MDVGVVELLRAVELARHKAAMEVLSIKGSPPVNPKEPSAPVHLTGDTVCSGLHEDGIYTRCLIERGSTFNNCIFYGETNFTGQGAISFDSCLFLNSHLMLFSEYADFYGCAFLSNTVGRHAIEIISSQEEISKVGIQECLFVSFGNAVNEVAVLRAAGFVSLLVEDSLSYGFREDISAAAIQTGSEITVTDCLFNGEEAEIKEPLGFGMSFDDYVGYSSGCNGPEWNGILCPRVQIERLREGYRPACQ